MKTICTLQGVPVTEDADGKVSFLADADIDADGSPHAYHPRDTGLDAIVNARNGSEWVGIVTDREGDPIIQGPHDPAPGYYVSPTAYQIPGFRKDSPHHYIDSEVVPFIVVSPAIIKGVKGIVLGCKAKVTNTRTGLSVACMVADVGPTRKIGELSIAAAKAIGIPSSPRNGGEEENVILYELWPDVPAPTGICSTYVLQPYRA